MIGWVARGVWSEGGADLCVYLFDVFRQVASVNEADLMAAQQQQAARGERVPQAAVAVSPDLCAATGVD